MPVKSAVQLVRNVGSEPPQLVSLGSADGLSAQAQGELVASVSDDILRPIQAVVGLIDGVLESALTARQRLTLENARSFVEEALGRTHDLYDFSRLQAGKLALEPSNFFVRATVGETLRALSLRAHKKGLELVHRVDPDVPDALVGDVGRLQQILRNLVENALDLTERGTVALDVAAVDVPECETPRLRFSVRDSGASTGRQPAGNGGLGFRIACRLIALMGGEVDVDSEIGRGSTFTFALRFGLQPQARERVAGGLRVLTVSEDEERSAAFDAWLREAGVDATAVTDGLGAMDRLWESATSGRPYGAILVDAGARKTDMPALVARIRGRRELAATRIVLLTLDEYADELGSYDVRIDAHLPKTAGRDRLLATLRG